MHEADASNKVTSNGRSALCPCKAQKIFSGTNVGMEWWRNRGAIVAQSGHQLSYRVSSGDPHRRLIKVKPCSLVRSGRELASICSESRTAAGSGAACLCRDIFPRMSRLLNSLLIWLLLAALPIQGMAAVVNASCAAGADDAHAVMTSASVHAGPDMNMAATADTHRNDAHHQDLHHPRMLMAATDDVSVHAGHHVSTQPGDHGHSSTHAHAGCSACASCCFGASAPPPAALTPTAIGHSDAVALSPSPLFVGFIPPALERPPRRLAA